MGDVDDGDTSAGSGGSREGVNRRKVNVKFLCKEMSQLCVIIVSQLLLKCSEFKKMTSLVFL